MDLRTLTVTSALLLTPAALAQTNTGESSGYERMGMMGPETGDWEFTLGGSGASDQDVENTDLRVDFSIGNYVAENLLLGLRQDVAYGSNPDTWSGATAGFVNYHFDFDAFRPFIGAAFGGLYGDAVQEDTFFAGPEAGLKWYAKDDTFLFGRVAYEFLFDNGDEIDDNFEDGRFVYTIGVGFNF